MAVVLSKIASCDKSSEGYLILSQSMSNFLHINTLNKGYMQNPPDVSPTTIEAVMGAMVKGGAIKKIGSSQSIRYIKS